MMDIENFKKVFEDSKFSKNKTEAFDKSHDEFDQIYKAFEKRMIALSKVKYVRIILIYSGHGVTHKPNGKHTPLIHMVHHDSDCVEKCTNIEDRCIRLGIMQNILVFAIFDCCRKVLDVESKGSIISSPGLYCLGYACQLNKVAISTDRGSRYTNDILDRIAEKKEKNGNVVLP